MIPLYTQEEYDKAKSLDCLPLKCYECEKSFLKKKCEIQRVLHHTRKKDINKFCSFKCTGDNKRKEHIIYNCDYCGKEKDAKLFHYKKYINHFCSHLCRIKWMHEHRDMGRPMTGLHTTCTRCGKEIYLMKSEINKNKNHFCSYSCNSKWRLSHKTKAIKISKAERWIAEQLIEKFPSLEFHLNRTEAIQSELDIYIPALKMAFEINGIYHYKPIHGEKTFNKIKNNDIQKAEICKKNGIELHSIDISNKNISRKENVNNFVDTIQELIKTKLNSNK